MEIEEIDTRLNQYAEILARARKFVRDEAAALVLVSEIGKHLRVKQMAEEREKRFSPNHKENHMRNGFGDSVGDQPASQRQLAFLRDLGVEFASGISKAEASRLIDEATGK